MLLTLRSIVLFSSSIAAAFGQMLTSLLAPDLILSASCLRRIMAKPFPQNPGSKCL